MTAIQLTVALAVKVLLLLALVGVLRRASLYRRSIAFVAYLFAILVLESLITFWPSQFWNWKFWDFSQSTYDILKLAVAIEVAVRALAAFPGTWRLAGRINMVILLGTAAAWLFAGAPGRPLVSTATIWLFAGTALVATYFHLPLHAWHRAILYGFTAYLTVFSTIVNIWTRHGFAGEMVKALGALDQFAYLALVTYWAYAAWRPAETFEGADPEVLRKLQLDDEPGTKLPAPAHQVAN